MPGISATHAFQAHKDQRKSSIVIGGGQLAQGILHGRDWILVGRSGTVVRSETHCPLIEERKDDVFL